MGLRIGADASPQHYAVGSIAALHSANIGEALAKFARYKRLVTPQEILLDFSGGEARLSIHWLLSFDPAPTCLVDGMFAAAVSIERSCSFAALVRLTGKRYRSLPLATL